jgi:exoribonuclease R
MFLRRRSGNGYRVHYAIADVASRVRPGGELQAETWRRGQSVYLTYYCRTVTSRCHS